ncbi:MAG: DUF5671 domain-containing protein [Candidatus Paceibacterota bacterium]
MENTNQLNPAGKETAKDAFLHLLSAATIYLSVIGFITLWWQIINFLVPDKLNPQGFGSGIYMTLIWGTSVLVVAFPVHILVSWIIGKDLLANPSKREAGVRKWLWYITLFVSALTMIIDLVILMFNFLRGDLTAQFFLKSLVILIVTAAIFGYYLWDLKKKEKASGMPKKIAWIAGAAILASIAYGFFLVGSPAKQRDIRFDEQRAGALRQIENSVANYWGQKAALPKDLGELSAIGYDVPKDPETSWQYEYSVTGTLSFKLCADFKTETPLAAVGTNPYYYSQPGLSTAPQNWSHGIGHTCFDTTIDPVFFKQSEKDGSAPNIPAAIPAK